jgi:hypothetical protein
MLLTPAEAELFFKLHRALMFFVNRQLHVLPHEIKTVDDYAVQSPEARLKVHKAFVDEIDLIEKFIDENPLSFSEEELEIVHSWRHLVTGQFFIFRYLKKYTVFLSTGKEPIAYGVLALSEPFEDLVGPYLPVMTETMLLPFKDKIVYDSILNSYSISFGGGVRRSLKDSYETAKKRLGIVTSLPIIEAHPVPKKSPAKMPAKRKSRNPFQGRWRITWMEQWDFVDEEVEGFFEFSPNNLGSFQFGTVRGDVDYRVGTRNSKPAVEFSWEGRDEMDPVLGRGWAVLGGDEIEGVIFFHHGDESKFRATRSKQARALKRK